MADPATEAPDRAELLRQLTDAHMQLALRDQELRQLVARDEEIARLRTELQRAQRDYMHVSLRLESMRHTRAWRTITLYWRLRGRLLGG